MFFLHPPCSHSVGGNNHIVVFFFAFGRDRTQNVTKIVVLRVVVERYFHTNTKRLISTRKQKGNLALAAILTDTSSVVSIAPLELNTEIA